TSPTRLRGCGPERDPIRTSYRSAVRSHCPSTAPPGPPPRSSPGRPGKSVFPACPHEAEKLAEESHEFIPTSVGIEGIAIVQHQIGTLPVFMQNAIADHQHVDLGAHQATEGILRGVRDRLAAHIETGVHQDRAAGLALEGGEEAMEAGIGLAMY